jgi:hypothetical protein
MGMSAQQVIQNDPEYLRRQLAAAEMARYQTPDSAAGSIGGLLGRGLANVVQGRGFFSTNDPALKRVADLQNIYSSVVQEVGADNPAEAFKQLASRFAAAGYGQEAAQAAQEAFKAARQEEDTSLRRRAIQVQEGQLDETRYRNNPELLREEALSLPDEDPRKQSLLTRYSRLAEEANYDKAKRSLELQKVEADTSYARSRAKAAASEAEGGGAASVGPVGKSGAYRTTTGRIASPTEMRSVTQEYRALEKTLETFNKLTTKDVKEAESFFNFVDGVVPKELAGKFFNETVGAQSRVAASQLLQQIDSLPPGAASDADMKAAKASFPGFGDSKNLSKWIDDTSALVEAYYNRLSDEFGLPKKVQAAGKISTRQSGKATAAPKVKVERLD